MGFPQPTDKGRHLELAAAKALNWLMVMIIVIGILGLAIYSAHRNIESLINTHGASLH